MFADDPRLHFYTELPELPGTLDIVHAGSSLQYVEDWRGMLTAFAGYRPRYLVLADIPAGDIKTFVTTQNYYGRKIRHWIWNIREFIDVVGSMGFTLTYKTRCSVPYFGHEQPCPMSNFPSHYRLDNSCQLIFSRAK